MASSSGLASSSSLASAAASYSMVNSAAARATDSASSSLASSVSEKRNRESDPHVSSPVSKRACSGNSIIHSAPGAGVSAASTSSLALAALESRFCCSAAEGLRSESGAGSSRSSSCSSSCVSIGRSRLEQLPQALKAEIFTHLSCRMLSLLSGSIRNSIQQIPRITPPVAALKVLAEYRSPSSPGDVALSAVNGKIHTLRRAVQAAKASQQLTQAANANARVTASASAAQPMPANAHTNQTLRQMKKTLNTLKASTLPNDRFPPHVLNLIAEYAPVGQSFHPEYPLTSFSPDKWTRFIGRVQHASPRPDIGAILASPCRAFPGKTKGETHVLTYIPPEVDGQPLTLNRFMAYIQHAKNGGKPIRLNIYWQEILKTYGDQPLPSDWFLVLKTCLPGTKDKTYPEQQAALKEFQKTNPEYRELHPVIAAVSIIMEYIQSGDSDTRLFSDEWTRTPEVLQGRFRLDFGGFGPGGPGLGLGVVLPCGNPPAIGT